MGLFDGFGNGDLQQQFPGAYAAGALNGRLAVNQDTRANNADARDQDSQNMMDEAFGWKRDEVHKEKEIQSGMSQAAQEGGYEGVIDYLKVKDPKRAMEFTKQKLALDKDMMDNDLYKTLIPVAKTKALAEGYGALGKMGYAILQAPPEYRSAMYEQMLPLVKQINPNAPDDVQSAAPMFLLAAAQSTDANKLVLAQKTAVGLTSVIGKTVEDIHKATQAYGADSKEVGVLSDSLTQQMTQQKTNETTAAGLTDVQKNTGAQQLSNSFQKQTKDFQSVANNYKIIMGSKIEPDSPTENMAFNDVPATMAYIKMAVPNARFNPKTFEIIENAQSVPEHLKMMLEHSIHGGLSVDERKSMKETSQIMYAGWKSSFDANLAETRRVAKARGLDPDAIVSPMVPVATPAPISVNSLSQMKDQAISQVKGAKIPEELKMQKLQQIEQMYQQQVKSAQGAGESNVNSVGGGSNLGEVANGE